MWVGVAPSGFTGPERKSAGEARLACILAMDETIDRIGHGPLAYLEPGGGAVRVLFATEYGVSSVSYLFGCSDAPAQGPLPFGCMAVHASWDVARASTAIALAQKAYDLGIPWESYARIGGQEAYSEMVGWVAWQDKHKRACAAGLTGDEARAYADGKRSLP